MELITSACRELAHLGRLCMAAVLSSNRCIHHPRTKPKSTWAICVAESATKFSLIIIWSFSSFAARRKTRTIENNEWVFKKQNKRKSVFLSLDWYVHENCGELSTFLLKNTNLRSNGNTVMQTFIISSLFQHCFLQCPFLPNNWQY